MLGGLCSASVFGCYYYIEVLVLDVGWKGEEIKLNFIYLVYDSVIQLEARKSLLYLLA